MLPSALGRWALLFGFWLLLAGPWDEASLREALPDLAVGLLAGSLATWASLHLLPPTPGRIHYGALLRLASQFLGKSVVAGFDVARRAFDPRLPLRPGYLSYPVRIPPGPDRAAFGALTSLTPGTLPVGADGDGTLVYHCLDLDQPIAASLASDEALLLRIRIADSAQ
jgi:multicomponent Na+:H+ antiporter subunit E